MDDKPKVYTPEVIPDAGFPLEGTPTTAITSSTQQTTNQTYGAKEMAEQGFPLKMVAKEVLSSAINTITKKITKAFEFTKSGALQIGEYINGVSGDIRISPDGITARNNAGNTTFSIDGDTGDAIFTGDVRASTFTSDYFNVDNRGNVVATSLAFANIEDAAQTDIATYQTFVPSTYVGASPTAANYQLVDNLELNINLPRTTNVGFYLNLECVVAQPAGVTYNSYKLEAFAWLVEIVEATGTWATSGGLPIDVINGPNVYGDIFVSALRSESDTPAYGYIGDSRVNRNHNTFGIVTVPAGKHKYRVVVDVRNYRQASYYSDQANLYIYRTKLSYFTLGSSV